jgi:hypothetical protein
LATPVVIVSWIPRAQFSSFCVSFTAVVLFSIFMSVSTNAKVQDVLIGSAAYV